MFPCLGKVFCPEIVIEAEILDECVPYGSHRGSIQRPVGLSECITMTYRDPLGIEDRRIWGLDVFLPVLLNMPHVCWK